MEQERTSDVCEFHADNELPLNAFLALQTQWRMVAVGMAGLVYQGLEYTSVPVVMDILRVPPRKRAALLADMQTMELAALPLLNARHGDS